MLPIVIGLLVCAGIAAFVCALVLIPARREGRDVLTSRGEDLVATLRETTGSVVDKVTPGSSDDAAATGTTPVPTDTQSSTTEPPTPPPAAPTPVARPGSGA